MKTTKTRSLTAAWLAMLAAAVVFLTSAGALAQAPLITGLGGPAGFGTNELPVGDDNSSASIALAPYNLSGLCFFGQTHTTMFVNNNGNVTFSAAVPTYTPTAFPASTNPMIAPWWADVDTRGGGTGSPPADRTYYYLADGLLVVTWYQVGYYNSHPTPTNTFQLVIRRTPTSADPNNYDIEFRYSALTWTTGDASGGANGLGGTPAQAGFDAGDRTNYLALPGSRTAAILNLLTTSNVTPAQPGLWRFNMRGCVLTSPCTTSADCGGNRPYCDPTTHLCTACTSDAQCSGATPACLTTGANAGSCVQCTTTNHTACRGGTPTCNTTTNVCQCTGNADCSGATPICDGTTRTCRACDAARTDCSGATPVCATSGTNSGRCVQCTATNAAALRR